MTGYELKSIMDNSTMHFWHAHHSQIYTTLRKLEDQGLVTSEMDDDDSLQRRTYTLTDAGRADLMEWLGQPMIELPQIKEDLLLRLFFSGQRPRQAVLDELRFQRQLHQNKLQVYLSLINNDVIAGFGGAETRMQDDVRFWQMTLDFGTRYEQMYLSWLDEVIAGLAADQ
jgi:DNA-binding PadR family transcriptional regulator